MPELPPFSGDLFTSGSNPTVGGIPVPSNVPAFGGGYIGNQAVNTTVNINFTADTFSSITSSILAGISASLDIVKNTFGEQNNAIQEALNTMTHGFLEGVGDMLGKIGGVVLDAVKNIGSHLGDILKAVLDKAGDILKDIRDTILPIMQKVESVVTGLVHTIQEINDKFIQPITTLVTTTIDTIASLTKAIEGDLHSGLRGILDIPRDISGALTTIDATMQRTVTQLGAYNKEAISVNLKQSMEDAVGFHVKSLGDLLTRVSSVGQSKTTFSDKVHLTEPNIGEAGAQAFDAVWSELKTFILSMFSSGKGAIDGLKTAFTGVEFLLGEAIELPVLLVGITLAIAEAMHPFLQWLEEDIASKAGLAKLSPGDALAAFVRGFIDNESLTEDLKARGFDESRIRVMKDLQQYLIDTRSVIDMWFRGIVTEEDMRQNMTFHAISKPDQDALIAQMFRVFSVETSVRGFRRGYLTEEQVRDVLRINRYAKPEEDLFISTMQNTETPIDVFERTRRDGLLSYFNTKDASYDNVPEAFADEAKEAGLNVAAGISKWKQTFVVPSLSQFIELYFRNVYTLTELEQVFDYYHIPSKFRNDFITARRPLIPFRTIPAMVAAGILNDAAAKDRLQAHGYSLVDAETLIAYAKTKTSKVKVEASGDLHAISVSNAREFWQLGALTDVQYHDILIAHGYDEASAKLTIDVESMQFHLKERKQIARDITDELTTGLITVDDANEIMSRYEFTEVERARVLKSLSKAVKQITKFPGESELRKMVEQDIIDVKTFYETIVLSGYSPTWAERIVNLYFGENDGPKIIPGTT